VVDRDAIGGVVVHYVLFQLKDTHILPGRCGDEDT